MTLSLSGVSVSRGILVAPAVLLHRNGPDVREVFLPPEQVNAEVDRYRQAILQTRLQLDALRGRIPAETPTEIASFIDAHLLMLGDAALSEVPIKTIRRECCNAEWALQLQRDALVAVFDAMDDPYLSTRRDDVAYVVRKILYNLLGLSGGLFDGLEGRLHGCILVADDLSAEEVMLLHDAGVTGLITEQGGAHSHASILARSFAMPAVAGVRWARRYLLDNESLVLDGLRGLILANSGALELAYARECQLDMVDFVARLDAVRHRPAMSRDGQRVRLMANIELPEEIEGVLAVNAGGIGLYRTEMLFLQQTTPPNEAMQFQVYRRAVHASRGHVLTIRTLDLGGDKSRSDGMNDTYLPTNPALGLRAVRRSLHEPEIFSQQLRAILRASAEGPVRLMLPMLTTLEELFQIKCLLDEQRAVLDRRGQVYDADLKVGGMIEVPAAALIADRFAEHLDFLSLGSNDLVQYTLAVDRMDEEVDYLYNPLHPAVLRLIQMTIVAGQKAGIPVVLCGEIAGDTRYTRLLLGMGLLEFSMYPATLLEVKQVITGSDIGRLRQKIGDLDRLVTAEDMLSFVATLNTL